MKLLGHESMTTSQRYVTAAGTETRSAAERGWVGGWRGDAVAFRFQFPPVEPVMWNST